MNCPSCGTKTEKTFQHCIRCGISLSPRTLWLIPLRSTLAWALRRSLAGGSAGFVGWVVLSAANRLAGDSISQSGHLLLTGFLGGIFLGTVEGMAEASAIKTLRGGLTGALAGLLGGGMASWVTGGGEIVSRGIAAILVAWAISGAAIGWMSGWLEPQVSRRWIGAVAGAVGAALGGYLGYQMYGSLLDVLQPQSWAVKRLLEGITGGILGALLWFVLGAIQKQFILRRRIVQDVSYKECHECRTFNVLAAWYCASCGALLQVSAPPEKLNLPANQALAQWIGACRYGARLMVTTAVVVAGLAGAVLGMINPFLGLFGLLAAALAGYILAILFKVLAELLAEAL